MSTSVFRQVLPASPSSVNGVGREEVLGRHLNGCSSHTAYECLLKLFLWWLIIKKVTQFCLTLCSPMDYTAHGILQARILLSWWLSPQKHFFSVFLLNQFWFSLIICSSPLTGCFSLQFSLCFSLVWMSRYVTLDPILASFSCSHCLITLVAHFWSFIDWECHSSSFMFTSWNSNYYSKIHLKSWHTLRSTSCLLSTSL